MTLQELLSELRDNILNDRSDQKSGPSDYLWSDATLVRYINEAQRRFCRKGLVLRDASTPEVCKVWLRQGVEKYVLHPSVLGVVSARLDYTRNDLTRTGHPFLAGYNAPDMLTFDVSNSPLPSPGRPLAFTTDDELGPDDTDALGSVVLKLYPIPDAMHDNVICNLRVVRLPLENLSIHALSAHPEIPEDFHLEMLDWAAYLALRIVDQDAGWVARANEFRASFEEHVKRARTDTMRKLFTPSVWGFGRNGYSWES